MDDIDTSHAALLQFCMGVKWPQRESNVSVFARANILPAHSTIRRSRLRLYGHLVRSNQYNPQPVHDLLDWTPKGLQRKGQANRTMYATILREDLQATRLTIEQAMNRESWKEKLRQIR